jgi:preprotein translocase subunit SecG
MNTVLIILTIIVALLLVLLVMVQNPKGGGLSSTFGGGGASMGGVQSTNTFLDKSTWTLAITMIVLILMTNILADSGSGVNTKSDLKETIDNRELIDDTPASTTDTPATPSTPEKTDDSTK